MTIKRINAIFFQGVKFNAYRKTTAQLNENALNIAYKVLFGKQGFHHMTKEEATRVNQLLKICERILNRYCAADAQNINNITMFLYLSKAINEFYRECSAGTNFLERQRIAEEKTKSKLGRMYYKGKAYFVRKLYLGDLFRDQNDWLPKPTKTYLRGALYETFGAYPEQLYAALTFYLVKEFYPDLSGPASWQIKQILRIINSETTVRHAQKERGTKSYDREPLYAMFLNAFDASVFAGCNGTLDLIEEIRKQLHVGKLTAASFVKRLKQDRPESPTLKRKKKTKI